MTRRRHLALGVATLLCSACASDQPTPTAVEIRVPLFAADGDVVGNVDVNLGTHLTGAEEVFAPTVPPPPGSPPPAESPAQGQAIFRVSDDGKSVSFNVHTNDGQGVINTGPGDFPAGEIRGQIDHARSRADR